MAKMRAGVISTYLEFTLANWNLVLHLSVFLGKAKFSKKTRILVCLCFYAINTVTFWAFHTVWINMLCNFLGISAIVWLYTKSIKTNLFVTGTILLVNCGCDIAATLPFISYRDGEVYSQVYAVISFLLIFICEIVMEKMITNNENTEKAQNFSLILTPICSIIMIGGLIYSGACTELGIAVVSFGFVIINFLMLYLYNLLLHSITEKYEMDLLKAQAQIYANQLDVIRQGEEKVKALRHDMKHHLGELMLLANKYNVPQMQQYIEQMDTFIQNSKELVASGNMEIDSILNYMLQKAKEELETVIVKVILPEEISHSFDINVLLGNLIENAIEAAEQTERKYLNVNITLKNGVLKIKIENSFLEPNMVAEREKETEKRVLGKKPLKEHHGIGLKNVKKIVDKYNGTMKISQHDDIFSVSLIMYMSKIENGI